MNPPHRPATLPESAAADNSLPFPFTSQSEETS